MSQNMREQFEDWYKENINKDGPFMSCGKLMRSEHAMFGLMCWQASRAALVVELPEKWPLFTVDEVKDILDLAGVPYK